MHPALSPLIGHTSAVRRPERNTSHQSHLRIHLFVFKPMSTVSLLRRNQNDRIAYHAHQSQSFSHRKARSQRTSNKQHLALLLLRAHVFVGLFLVGIVVDDVHRLLHVAKDKVAVAVVGLYTNSQASANVSRHSWLLRTVVTHMQPTLQLTVSSELHEDDFVEREADEVQGLVDRIAAVADGGLGVSH